MTNDSKLKIMLNEEDLQQLGEAMTKALQLIHQRAHEVGRQAGESLVAINKRGWR